MAALLDAIGVALVDVRMQSSTPAVVPGAALPRPRLGRVGGYVIYVSKEYCLVVRPGGVSVEATSIGAIAWAKIRWATKTSSSGC